MATRESSARLMSERQPSSESRKSLVNEALSSRTVSIQSHRVSLRTESNSFREPEYAAPHANHTTHLVPDEGVLGFVRRTFLGASTVAPPMGASDIAERLAQQFGNPEDNVKQEQDKANRASHIPRPSAFKAQTKDSVDQAEKTKNGVTDAPVNGTTPQSKSNEPATISVGALNTSPGSFKTEPEAKQESSPPLTAATADGPDASASMQQSPKDDNLNLPSKKNETPVINRPQSDDNQSVPLIEDQAVRNLQIQNTKNEPKSSAAGENEVIDEVVDDEKQNTGSSAIAHKGKTQEEGSHDATLTTTKEGSFSNAANTKPAPTRSMTMGAGTYGDHSSDIGAKPSLKKITSDNGFQNANWTPPSAFVATLDDNNKGIKTSPETEGSKSVSIQSAPKDTALESPEAEDSIEQRSGAMATLAASDVALESPDEPIIDYELSLRANNHEMESTKDRTCDCERIKNLWRERMAKNRKLVKEDHNKKASEFETPLAYFLDLHSFIVRKGYSVPLLGVLIGYYGEDHPRVQEFSEALREEGSKEQSLKYGMPHKNGSESELLFEKKDSSSTETNSTFDTARMNSPPQSSQPSSPRESARTSPEKEKDRSAKSMDSRGPHISNTPAGLVVSRKNGGERQYHAHYGRRRPSCRLCCLAPRAD